MADEPIEALENKTPLQAVSNRPSIGWRRTVAAECSLRFLPDSLRAAKSPICRYSATTFRKFSRTRLAGSRQYGSQDRRRGDGHALQPDYDRGRKNQKPFGRTHLECGSRRTDRLPAKELGGEDVNFFPGVSYRHLLKIKGGSKRIVTTPPHDVPGTPYKDVLVRAADTDGEPTARQLNELIERSMTLLENHPVNLARKAAGKIRRTASGHGRRAIARRCRR